MNSTSRRFKTIVVATDLTDANSSALRYAQAIARLHQSTLVIVHITDPLGYAFPEQATPLLAADRDARAELARLEAETRAQGIATHSVIEHGVVCERILQAVSDHRADLLVLGTRAMTEAGRIALGAVARQLLASAPCPVLTVSPDADATIPWAGRWRRVLAATDFSASSLAALRLAHRIAHCDLLALHVSQRANDHACSHCLERLRFLAPFNESHTVPVEHIVTSGDAAKIIAEHAWNIHADLVVLGAPLNMLTEEDLLSSTVLQVISYVNCPVLCVPPARETPLTKLIQEVATQC